MALHESNGCTDNTAEKVRERITRWEILKLRKF